MVRAYGRAGGSLVDQPKECLYPAFGNMESLGVILAKN
jgi:hypothetical protein